MTYTPDLIDEMELLLQYDLSSDEAGIRVHDTAEPAIIEAARRLHAKGLTTEEDGGFLTERGRETAEHTQAAISLLNPG